MSPRSVLPELMTPSRSLLWIEPVLKKLNFICRIAKRRWPVLQRKMDADILSLRPFIVLRASIDQEAADASLAVDDWARRDDKTRI
jgi:hypothetical protein